MNQTNLDDTLDVLNDLLQTSKDGEAGFHACAEDLRDPQLKALEKSLPAEIHQVIERQYQGVLRHHDRVRALRDARA